MGPGRERLGIVKQRPGEREISRPIAGELVARRWPAARSRASAWSIRRRPDVRPGWAATRSHRSASRSARRRAADSIRRPMFPGISSLSPEGCGTRCRAWLSRVAGSRRSSSPSAPGLPLPASPSTDGRSGRCPARLRQAAAALQLAAACPVPARRQSDHDIRHRSGCRDSPGSRIGLAGRLDFQRCSGHLLRSRPEGKREKARNKTRTAKRPHANRTSRTRSIS